MRGVETKSRFQPPAGGAIGECQYAYVRSQGRVPGKPMKFGEDRTMNAEVMSDFVFCGEQ